MSDKNLKSAVNNDSVNPVIAAVAGAVVAGVAVASAIVLSDKQNQDKIKEVASDIKNNVNDTKSAVVDKATKLEDIATNAVNEVKNI